MAEASGSRDRLDTERVNEATRDLDVLATAEAFDLFQSADEGVAEAVGAAKNEIVAAVELVVEHLRAGGRLFYVGAGTSGRLGVLDAAECPPTFQTDPELVQGLIAGGPDALVRSAEGAEDQSGAGAAVLDRHGVRSGDVVFGIAAGGTTPFVHGALARARELEAATIFLACVPRDQAPDGADVSIRVCTGPEVVAGSTRLKAGTATKMVLNRISTLSMVRLGKVYRNFMVDLSSRSNEKLIERAISLVERITELPRGEAARLLERAEGQVKVAVLMHARGCRRDAALERLDACGGHLRRALED